ASTAPTSRRSRSGSGPTSGRPAPRPVAPPSTTPAGTTSEAPRPRRGPAKDWLSCLSPQVRGSYDGAMKINEALSQAFDDQITLELQAAIVYRQLSIEMAVRDLPGMASWFAAQSAEELDHAEKFTEHVLDRGNHPQIGDIAAPKVTVDSPVDAFR